VTLCWLPTMPTLVLVTFDQENEQEVTQRHCPESLGAGCSPLGSLPYPFSPRWSQGVWRGIRKRPSD